MAGHTCNQSDLAFKTVVRVVEDQYREYLEGTGVIGHTCHQSDLTFKTVVRVVEEQRRSSGESSWMAR